jgi:hypothetical protein
MARLNLYGLLFGGIQKYQIMKRIRIFICDIIKNKYK